MGVETFSGLIALVIEAARIFVAAEALESAPEEHPVAGEKKGSGMCEVLSRKAKQYSPLERSLPVAGYCPQEAELDLDFVR